MKTPDMQGKTVLITGGTGGIGYETALGLAKLGATVIVTGRDATRGTKAVSDLQNASGNAKIELRLADLSVLSEVRRLARELGDAHPTLDVPINNAGGLYGRRVLTPDGLEATFVMNFLSPFLLTRELLPALHRAAHGRVVNVSGGFPVRRLDFTNLQGERKYGFPLGMYSHAKLANLLWTFELARHERGNALSVHAVYPGSADTAMTRGDGLAGWFRSLGRRAGQFGPPAQAAISSIRGASDPALDDVTGHYLNAGGQDVSPPRAALNPGVAQQLWTHTEALLRTSDPATQREASTGALHTS